jgi:peptidoglycan/xylan/chitin deacetylase (PgdA/CDA1 family)
MTWDMIGRMHRAGVTIGSHTVSHTLLPTEAIETVNSELAGSRQTLERHLGARVKHFAYPDGRFNPAVVEAVNAAGYRFAYGSCNSRDVRFPLLTIPRKVLWERSCLNALDRFSPAVMSWVIDRPLRCEHEHA